MDSVGGTPPHPHPQNFQEQKTRNYETKRRLRRRSKQNLENAETVWNKCVHMLPHIFPRISSTFFNMLPTFSPNICSPCFPHFQFLICFVVFFEMSHAVYMLSTFAQHVWHILSTSFHILFTCPDFWILHVSHAFCFVFFRIPSPCEK